MIDFRLYVILDRQAAGSRSLLTIAKATIAGGATIVQYRDKVSDKEAFHDNAIRLLTITKKAKVPLVINDRIDIAMAIDAEGLHIGQEDMSISLARARLGPHKILGVSAGNAEDALQAQKDGADYLGVGPISQTNTKKDAGSPIGISGLRQIVAAVSIPVVAIGGINAKNAKEVIEAGASGVAVISAILGAKDPGKATRKLRLIIDSRR